MKQLIINLVAVVVISIGGFSLIQPQPIQAQPNTIKASTIAPAASCSENGNTLKGDVCYVNDSGHCECYDL
jgi:hypothetical protein